jgi:hypothetical protein
MGKSESVQDRGVFFLRRVARIWSGVVIGLGIIIFISEIIEAFAMELGDYPWFENLIPVSLFLAVVGLGIAWRDERLGGGMAVGFVLLNLILYLFTGRTRVSAVVLILLPVFIPGVLFLVCWWRELKT